MLKLSVLYWVGPWITTCWQLCLADSRNTHLDSLVEKSRRRYIYKKTIRKQFSQSVPRSARECWGCCLTAKGERWELKHWRTLKTGIPAQENSGVTSPWIGKKQRYVVVIARTASLLRRETKQRRTVTKKLIWIRATRRPETQSVSSKMKVHQFKKFWPVFATNLNVTL